MWGALLAATMAAWLHRGSRAITMPATGILAHQDHLRDRAQLTALFAESGLTLANARCLLSDLRLRSRWFSTLPTIAM